jgi:hypothetical protein
MSVRRGEEIHFGVKTAYRQLEKCYCFSLPVRLSSNDIRSIVQLREIKRTIILYNSSSILIQLINSRNFGYNKSDQEIRLRFSGSTRAFRTYLQKVRHA